MSSPAGKLISSVSQQRGGLFSKRKKLNIYSDGYSLRQYDDDVVLSEALWTEVRDVTWYQPQKNVHMYGHFGLVGLLIMALVTYLGNSRGGNSDDAAWLYIHPADNSRKITIDSSFNDPEPVAVALGPASRQVWVDEAMRELKRGGEVTYGKVTVQPAGIAQGKQVIEWSQIIDVTYADEDGTLAINWSHPAKRSDQTMRVKLGYRGEALIQIVNQKTGKKSTSLASKLGKL